MSIFLYSLVIIVTHGSLNPSMPHANAQETQLLKRFRTLFSVDRHADFDLQAQIAHIRSLEQSLPPSIGLYLLDLHAFRYAYMSQRSLSITGIAPAIYEQQGLNYYFEHLHPEDRLLITTKTLPMYQKQLSECSPQDRLKLHAALNYRIKSDLQTEDYRHVLTQLSIRSVNEDYMPVLLLGVFSQLRMEQFQGQDFKLYLAENGALTKTLVDELITANPLTDKEVLVLQKLSEGLSSKRIGDLLFISKHTVDTHRRNIIRKLGVTNSVEAVIYCRSFGWI